MSGNITSESALYYDTFTGAIDLGTKRIQSIEWVGPTTVGHTCTIKQGTAPIIEWTCSVQYKGEIKYFHGNVLRNLTIAVSGVQSGVVIVHIK
jgi:hypothetical protein